MWNGDQEFVPASAYSNARDQKEFRDAFRFGTRSRFVVTAAVRRRFPPTGVTLVNTSVYNGISPGLPVRGLDTFHLFTGGESSGGFQ